MISYETLRTILTMSITGSIIAVILFALKPFVRNHLPKSTQYYLWLVVIAALVVPISKLVVLPDSIPNVPTISKTVDRYVVDNEVIFERIKPYETENADGFIGIPESSMAEVDALVPDTRVPEAVDLFRLFHYLGVIVYLAFVYCSYAAFTGKMKRRNTTATTEEHAMLAELCDGKSTPLLCRNPLAATPMMIGVFRPAIILPDREYTNEQLRAVLLHELTHLRRKDVLVKWLSVLVAALHWFNPIVWLVRREIDRACELSCDEAVIRNLDTDGKQSYGETLLYVAADSKTPRAVLSTTMCEEKKALKERLGAIMKSKKHSRIAIFVSAALILVISVMSIVLGAGSAAAKSNAKNDSTDSGAYKPSIMYENVIYSISPYKTDTYSLSDASLSFVGTVESVVNGTTLPQQNLQASGNTDLLNCNIYTASARYPDHLIVLDKNGNYSVYIAERNERYMTLNDVRAIAEKFGENLTINDLRDFIGTDIGSGLHIPQFSVDDGEYYLTVGAGGVDSPVLYTYFGRDKDVLVDNREAIDIRYYDIDKFIADGTRELVRPLPEPPPTHFPFMSSWKPLHELPADYSTEQAVVDSVYVNIHDSQIYNQVMVDQFYANVYSGGGAAFLRVMQYTIEGDAILTDYQYDGEMFAVTHDSTRDKFGAGEITTYNYKYLVADDRSTSSGQTLSYYLSNEKNIFTEAGNALIEGIWQLPPPSAQSESAPRFEAVLTSSGFPEQRIEAVRLTTSWSYIDENGNSVAYESDSPHALQLENYDDITLRLNGSNGEISFDFGGSYKPHSILVQRWGAVYYMGRQYIESSINKNEPITVNGNTIRVSNDGNDYIYEVYAVFEQGSSYYAFRVNASY